MNKEVAFLTFRQGRIADAIPFYEKATALMDSDFHDFNMLVTCYLALGDTANASRAATLTVARAEKTAAQDPGNGFALGTGAYALAVLGDGARAREWGERAILIDPENLTTRYNLACGFAQLNDTDGMLELLEPYFEQGSLTQLIHALVDPDLDAIRRDPRLLVMVRAAMARLDARPEMLPAEARNLLAAD